MLKVLWNYGLVIPALVNGFFILTSDASAAEILNVSDQNEPLAQVTSVSELSDVQPTDWAFQALQSLVERYGVIAGYPDGTFKGNRALTRYEFAAGLNAALSRLNELIATNTADLVRQEDLATLQKLQAEFASELVALRGKLDTLEARTAQVEANQFSTTTKLVGDATFVVADTFGDRVNNTPADDTEDSTNAVFAYRTRLFFQTSFTGRDQLTAILTQNTIPNLTSTTGTSMTRFTFDAEGREGIYLSQLVYRFPVGKQGTIWIGPRALQPAIFTPTLNASVGGLNGAASRFAAFNPTIYRPGFDGAGAAFAYKFNNQLQLNAGYITFDQQANLPDEGNGFFNGNNTALAQLTISPNRQLDIGLTYVHKYFGNGSFNLTGGTGSAFARNPFGQNATSTDNFGLQFNWRANTRFHLGGWFGYTLANQLSNGDNDATIINAALTFGFPDLFKEGNLAGFIIGVPPKVTSNDYRPTPTAARREDPDTSLHLEAFYTFRVNDNIRITPSCYLITKPEHNDANDPIWVGTLRTTFTF
ncbi:iron uptake porin [Nostoc spongiaeforme FACHB-130]|uniref:Iron uptake porin n=1 Tax=Nostoc spongiaeforme FACHB-130 TaxID=1357510 RepID=A0ABR8FWT3_9NOSO|nr:iron uptake porin [Nostoc spongiaeforme]MBD2595629.1 iron uptake porin [Nostoc spongiaeforme FACHB-130]